MTVTIAGITFHLFEIFLLVFLCWRVFFDLYRNGFSLTVYNIGPVKILLLGFLLFIGSILLSTLNAYSVPLVIKSLSKWIEIIILVFLIFLYISDVKRLKLFYWLLFFSVFIAIVDILVRVFLGEYQLFAYRIFPSYEACFAFALLLPFLVKKKSAILYALMAAAVFSLMLSLSRAAWLGAVIVVIYAYIYLSKTYRRVIVVFAVLASLAIASIPTARILILYKITSVFEQNSLSNRVRTNLLEIALLAYKQNPLFGVGALNFPQFILNEGLRDEVFARNLSTLEPHNTFLQIAAEEGTLGLIAFLLILLAVYKSLFRGFKLRKVPDPIFPYLLGLQLFALVMMLNLMLGYIASQFRFYFAILVGMSVAMTKLSFEDSEVD